MTYLRNIVLSTVVLALVLSSFYIFSGTLFDTYSITPDGTSRIASGTGNFSTSSVFTDGETLANSMRDITTATGVTDLLGALSVGAISILKSVITFLLLPLLFLYDIMFDYSIPGQIAKVTLIFITMTFGFIMAYYYTKVEQ